LVRRRDLLELSGELHFFVSSLHQNLFFRSVSTVRILTP
jgi:hypothetical protein